MCKDSVPYLTMAGAMKLVSAYYQPMADRNTNKAIDLSGVHNLKREEKRISRLIPAS